MDLFSANCYKKWVNGKILEMPKKGRGQYRKLADSLHTSPTIITQVFKGERELTPEQAILMSRFFGLSKMEERYLILLVNLARASSHHYQALLRDELGEIRQSAKLVGQRVPRNLELTEDVKAILYSNWYYLAAWSVVAMGNSNAQMISSRLQIPMKKATEAVAFLKKYALILDKNGKLVVGPTLLHLDSDSPQIPRHHQNWRLRAFRKYEAPSEGDLSYSAPVTLSRKDAAIVREKCLKFISEAVSVVKGSPSEELFCLCLDWFEV